MIKQGKAELLHVSNEAVRENLNVYLREKTMCRPTFPERLKLFLVFTVECNDAEDVNIC